MKSIILLTIGASLVSAAAINGPGCPAPTRTPTKTVKPPHTTTAPPDCDITTTHTCDSHFALWMYKGYEFGAADDDGLCKD
ncbi:hypothetical protein VFPPC_14884 [Pochonia chlamydosporia 170]|uniref:Uncharacterized protein n=1 Tax=Pochonia chlamydosporia 170 TaxID=1380566 RepID=A0A179FBW3_METCM|nr:hypothetical protein VFPPC_14884 [Pochonia chlamydosporia 170]OAQ62790.1 hypothetical protein VFPPC_14884 [Pochonia chlamydosporia 170]